MEALQKENGIIMTKKLNSFKNIFSVLMALLLLGIAAGPASAAITVTGGGNNIIAGAPSQAVNTINITSGAAADLSTTISIAVPSGLTFNNTPSDLFIGTIGVVMVGTPVVTSTLITIPVTQSSAAGNSVLVNGIKLDVSPTATVGSNSLTITSLGGATTGSVAVTKPTNTHTSKPLAKGQNGQAINDVVVASVTTGDIGTGTYINLTIPSDVGVTFNTSVSTSGLITTTGTGIKNIAVTPYTVSAIINATLNATETVTFTTGVQLNVTSTATNFSYNVITTAVNTSSQAVTTVVQNNDTYVVPTNTHTSKALVKGQTGQAINAIVVQSVVTNDIGNNTYINLTIPSGVGVTFNTSVSTSGLILTNNSAGLRSIAVTANTVSAILNASLTATDNVTFTTGIQLNVTGTPTNFSYSVTTTAASAGSQAVTTTVQNNDTFVAPRITYAGDTVYLDLDGQTGKAISAVVVQSVVTNDIGNNTYINLTIPSDVGVTFDTSVSTSGLILTNNSAGLRSVTVTANTVSAIINASLTATDNVTFTTGIKINVTSSATAGTVNFTVKTTAANTGSQEVSQEYTTAGITKTIVTASTINSPDDVTSLGLGNITTLTWTVTNATSSSNFGGKRVNFATNGTPSSLNISYGTTSSAGTVSVNFTAPATTGTYNVTATIDGTTVSDVVNITVIAGSPTKLAIIPDTPKLAPTGVATITVKAQDASGNNVTTGPGVNDSVRLAVGGDAFVTSTNPVNMSNGTATFTVQKSTPGSTGLTALDENGTSPILNYATGTQVFTLDIGSIVLTPSTTSLAVNGSVATLSVQLYDVNGNPLALPGQSITITSSNTSLATVGTSPATSNANGIAVSNLTSKNVTGGTVSVNATITNQTGVTLYSNVSVSLVPATAAPTLTTITVTPATASVVVNGTVNFTATSKDQFLANMTGIIITWNSSNSTVGTINSTGVFTALANGTTTITATNGSVTSNLVTVTVTSISVLPPAVAAWDADSNGIISKTEAVAAVRNYLHGGGISKADAVAVVRAYLHPT